MNDFQRAKLVLFSLEEWPYFLVAYMMTIMATFLTGVWGLSIIHASQIMNFYSGSIIILPLVMDKLICCTRGFNFTVTLSKVAFLLGLVMLSISVSGTCREDEPLCISTTKRILFYTALVTLAVAVSAHEIWTSRFLSVPEHLDGLTTSSKGKVFMDTYSATAVTLLISYIKPWWIKLLTPTIYAAMSSCAPRCNDDGNNERVEADMGEFEQEDDGREYTLFLPAFFLCIWSILVSVVFTVGETFFILQATDLNPQFWFMKITILYLPLIKETVKSKIKGITCGIFPVGLIASMIFATLSCITAAKVETRRLGVVISEGVVDDPEAIISMSMFWLFPQFILLGLGERSFDDHLAQGLKEVTSRPRVMSGIIRAVGCYCGVLSVYVVSELKPTWIQDTLNTSRLDNYYWFLTTVSSVNLVLFVLITVTVRLCSKSEQTDILV